MKPVKVSALMTLMMVDEVATVHASADLRSGDVAAEVERWLLRCHDHPRAADVRLWLDRYDAQQQPEANKLALITPPGRS